MKLILTELNNEPCAEYIKENFTGDLFFSDSIANRFQLSLGSFYTIVPEGTSQEHLYNLSVGGCVVPFRKELIENSVMQVHNLAEPYVKDTLYRNIKEGSGNCICLEDFSADLSFSSFIEAKRTYYLVNGRVCYLLDKEYDWNAFLKYYNAASGYGFICILTSLPGSMPLAGIKKRQEISEELKKKLMAELTVFLVEIYDGESYLIWISNVKGHYFLEELRKSLPHE